MAYDLLQLEVSGIETMVLTGIYSEETHLPQPLRVSVTVDLALPEAKFAPDTPLHQSKNYMDLKKAVTESLPEGLHFTLVEAVAEHIIAAMFAGDERVRRVEVKIVKLAISQGGEEIGIRLVRHRA
ncbi:dihydroneopterin aldolase [Sphingomonas oligoaromativorans]|uniref:dihydroneopterin aldolase n=1 Tax=Sphingomonas oligoaromativorans TaxID=575322 RepID=UPI00141EB836|nr:dihydroneopterin aldolase [Sphingomonas oligoaromativorans]NIJ34168.1 dihydroneopterin aldolase [Sphingomonas oligoaromativorans]